MQQQQQEFDYKKYLQLIDKHKTLFAVVALVIMTAAVIAAYVIPKKYEAKSTVFIEKNVISELVKGIAVTPSMEDSIKVLSHSITSRTLLLKVMGELDMTAGKNEAQVEELIKEVQKNVSVSIKDKNLFILTFRNGNPRIARDFINTLVRRYVEENVSSKREESYGAIKFLGEQLDTFREKMSKAEGELNTYKSSQGGVISIDEGKLFEENNAAKQKLYDVQLRRRHLEGLKPVTRKAGDPLQMKLMSMQKRLDELRVEYTDSYPEVVKLKSDIDTVKEQMSGRKSTDTGVVDPQELDRVDAELNALKVSEQGLQRYIATNQALLNRIPTAKAGLEKLEMEKKSAKELYDQLMSRHGQSEVSKQMEVQDKTTTFRIVDPAVMPVQPVSPNRVKIILMGIVAGLGGALALLLGLDFLDRSVKNAEAAKNFGVPVLAVIPRMIDLEATNRQWKKDLRLYVASGAYLSIIVGILLTEVVGFSVIDKVIGKVMHL